MPKIWTHLFAAPRIEQDKPVEAATKLVELFEISYDDFCEPARTPVDHPAARPAAQAELPAMHVGDAFPAARKA